MHWQEKNIYPHGDCLMAVTKIPFLNFYLINHSPGVPSSPTYALCIHVAGYIVDRRLCQSQDEGKAIACEWLKHFRNSINEILGEET